MARLSYAEYYGMNATDFSPGDQIAATVVAVIGFSGYDWAAYIGDCGTGPAEIATNGMKLSQAKAEKLFPTIAATRAYRE